MISWGQLLNYSESKVVRGFDFFVILSVAVGNLNEVMKFIDVGFYLPSIYRFWFIGGICNLAGVLACKTLSPPEIRLHRSVEKYIDAKRAAAAKSDEDDVGHVQHESSAISTALFSTLGIELSVEQKISVASRLFDHLNVALETQERHSNVLSEQWAAMDRAWSWEKVLVAALFAIGLALYGVFLILLIAKGWSAIRAY